MRKKTTELPGAPAVNLQRMVRRRPTRSSSTHLLEDGTVLHIDRRIMPLRNKCCQCSKMKPDCAPDEGDGGWWCIDCIEAWEKKTGQHWEDGTPLPPPNDKVSHSRELP